MHREQRRTVRLRVSTYHHSRWCREEGPDAGQVEGSRFEVNYTANAISTLLGLIYFIGFWVWRQQTPGMMPFNMRVVRADTGEGIDWVRGLLRYVGLLISFVVIFIGVIWAAFDSRKQGWHDKIANTVVVRPA